MKKLFFLLSLSIVSLSWAKEISSSYLIGTPFNPVTIAEYCTFLSDSSAVQSETSLTSVEDKFLGEAKNAIKDSGETGNYQFTVTLDQMNQSILEVPSQEAQQLFESIRTQAKPERSDALRKKSGTPPARAKEEKREMGLRRRLGKRDQKS